MMRISIAMCTYNGARYVEAQLGSLLAQTRTPDELVVCDDGSQDATVPLLERFAARAPFPVHIHANEKNLGSTKNFEKAIGLCTGEIIVLADQDDVWRADKLERTADAFAHRDAVGLVFSDAEVVDERLQPLGYNLWQAVRFTEPLQRRLEAGDAFEVLLRGYLVTGTTMAFRSRYRDLVLPIPEEWVQDEWIALLVSTAADVAALPLPLVKYRQHANQQIGKQMPSQKGWTDRIAAARRPHHDLYYAEAARYRQAYERLVQHDAARLAAPAGRVKRKADHYLARARIRARQSPRWPLWLTRETAALHYHRFSGGWTSAIKDLLFGSKQETRRPL